MTKEEKKIYNKNWRIKNKEKIILTRKNTYDEVKDTPDFKEKKRIADKKYRDKNKEKKRISDKKYREENKEKLKIYFQDLYNEIKDTTEFKEKRKIYHKKYYDDNKEKLKKYQTDHKEERNSRERTRYEKDPVYRVSRLILSGIKKSFSGRYKKSKTLEILGCSFEEFKLHLESKFEPWMTWENHGLYNGELEYGWDIDHIIPNSSAITEEDVIRLNHYTNLQPLCSKVNRDIKKDNK